MTIILENGKKKAAEFYEEGICTLMKCYDKCLNLNGDYFGKW